MLAIGTKHMNILESRFEEYFQTGAIRELKTYATRKGITHSDAEITKVAQTLWHLCRRSGIARRDHIQSLMESVLDRDLLGRIADAPDAQLPGKGHSEPTRISLYLHELANPPRPWIRLPEGDAIMGYYHG